MVSLYCIWELEDFSETFTEMDYNLNSSGPTLHMLRDHLGVWIKLPNTWVSLLFCGLFFPGNTLQEKEKQQ